MVSVSANTRGVKASRGNLSDLIKPPPRGLIPLGDSGFYRTPDVISPFDCENYPDSPYCGGNPINNPLKNSPVTIDADVSIDECGATVSVGGSLGYVKTPRTTISYRKAGKCRNDYENPRVEPPDFNSDYQPKPIQPPGGFDRNDEVIMVVTYNTYSEAINWFSEYGYDQAIYSRIISFEGLSFPGKGNAYTTEHGFDPSFCTATATVTITNKIGEIWASNRLGSSEISTVYTSTYQVHIHPQLQDEPGGVYRMWKLPNQLAGFTQDFTQMIIYHGRFEDINRVLKKEPVYDNYINEGFDQSEGVAYTEKELDISEGQIVFCRKLSDLEDLYKRNPPPPDPPKKHCCMQCCSPANNSSNNNPDLKEILTILRRIDKNVGVFPTKVTIFDSDETKEEAQPRVLDIASISQGIVRIIEQQQKITKIIGIDTFPITLPASMIEKVDNNIVDIVFDWFTPDEIQINNVMSFQVYVLKYLNGVLGHWQQKIKIEDTDALKEGNQSKEIVIVDIANALRDLITLETGNHKALGLITDVVVKIITEVCNAKLDIAKTKLIVRDIQQFLDYTSRELSIDVPMSINIPDLKEITITGNETEEERQRLEAEKKAQEALKNDLAKYLQPGHCKVIYEDWDGNKSLTDYLLHIATLIATSRA